MIQHTSEQQKQDENQQKYEKTQMQREIVIQRLKEQGCRITKQRMVLLDIILNENCSSCKEIYYKASRIDSKIGTTPDRQRFHGFGWWPPDFPASESARC